MIAPPLCPRGNYGTDERKVWRNVEATGQAGIAERENKVGCLRREQSRGRSGLTAQSRKVLNCTSEEISEGSLTPALYPQCIPLMYYSSVDGSGTRVSTGPPGAPSQRSNGCFTLSSHALMAEGLCLFNSGYLNWVRKPTHTHIHQIFTL